VPELETAILSSGTVDLARPSVRGVSQLTVLLIGQPNCGKSTIFNHVVGYRSETANFPGSTVEISQGLVRLNGSCVQLLDLPGIYSLTSANPAEASAKKLLLSSHPDLLINVLDASLLSRSLEFTLELRELGLPMMVCLNMMDDAEKKGISISADELSQRLGVPVKAAVAAHGQGIRELFDYIKNNAVSVPSVAPQWSRDVEDAVRTVESALESAGRRNSSNRFVAVKLLEGDVDALAAADRGAQRVAEKARHHLESLRGKRAESITMAERHDEAMRIFEEVAVVGRPQADVRLLLDSVLTHPFWGYVFLAGIFLGLFWGVFGIGSVLERALQPMFDSASAQLTAWVGASAFGRVLIRSLWDGFAGGAMIVLPYLIPFLFGLAFLEDVGYLPRVAYLTDGLLHRMGLHGTSVLPFVLGYGCSVPACMATRILPSRRDRFIASVLATLVPCSARSNVILALVGFYLGWGWALGIFVFNAVVVVLSGWLLTRIWPEVSPGMVLEVPRYQIPSIRIVALKVWFRLREFVVLSWPLLIAGSAVLGVAEYWHWDHIIDAACSPLTGLLGLPSAVGTTLVFGLLRKELSMIMLVQALGTTALRQVMSVTQIVVFTIFVTFYIPCVATIAALVKEIGRKMTVIAVTYSLAVAITLSVAARLIFSAFGGK
jgi:ferrous iron transport protein B